MAFRYKFYFFLFLHMTYGCIISTQSLFHDISSANLDGNLPYLLFDSFVRWKVSQLVTSLRMSYLILGQYKCLKIIVSVLSIPGQKRYIWYQYNEYILSI